IQLTHFYSMHLNATAHYIRHNFGRVDKMIYVAVLYISSNSNTFLIIQNSVGKGQTNYQISSYQQPGYYV
ncbi:MAG: hypothetical protein WCY83_05290, partial [Bacteroidales bacterium]